MDWKLSVFCWVNGIPGNGTGTHWQKIIENVNGIKV